MLQEFACILKVIEYMVGCSCLCRSMNKTVIFILLSITRDRFDVIMHSFHVSDSNGIDKYTEV